MPIISQFSSVPGVPSARTQAVIVIASTSRDASRAIFKISFDPSKFWLKPDILFVLWVGAAFDVILGSYGNGMALKEIVSSLLKTELSLLRFLK